MTRAGCWCMATISTGAALTADRPITGAILIVVTLGWLRCAAREALREQWRRRWL